MVEARRGHRWSCRWVHMFAYQVRWCASHHAGGRSQPRQQHPSCLGGRHVVAGGQARRQCCRTDLVPQRLVVNVDRDRCSESVPARTASDVAALYSLRSRLNRAASRNSCAFAKWALASSNALTVAPADCPAVSWPARQQGLRRRSASPERGGRRGRQRFAAR